jgi:hypothetical protein
MVTRGFVRPHVFTWYSFEQAIPLDYGISSFVIEVVEDGISVMEDNGGGGFPFQDMLLPQPQQSCQGASFSPSTVSHLNVTVAVRFPLLMMINRTIIRTPL